MSSDHDAHKCDDHSHEHEHGHHKEKKVDEHNHEHEHHEHKHSHAEEEPKKDEEEIPAWKKQALEQGAGDPMSLNWNVDSNKMEE